MMHKSNTRRRTTIGKRMSVVTIAAALGACASNPDKIDAAYDRAEFLDERRTMMQEWANYMDAVAREGNVISLTGKRKKALNG